MLKLERAYTPPVRGCEFSSETPSAPSAWLLQAAEGIYTVKGRARLPAGASRPTLTKGGQYTDAARGWKLVVDGLPVTPEIPPARVAWGATDDPTVWAFTVRFPGLSPRLRDEAETEVAEMLWEAAGALAYRVDASTWEAQETDRAAWLPGCDAEVILEDGRPVMLRADGAEDVCEVMRAFRAVFGDGWDLEGWRLSESQRGAA